MKGTGWIANGVRKVPLKRNMPRVRTVRKGKRKIGDLASGKGVVLAGIVDVAQVEMSALRLLGGDSVVELTCGGIRPDPKGLADIQLGTGVNIIMGCGYYVEEYQDPKNHQRTVDSFAKEMIGQVLEGAWGTDIRAGISVDQVIASRLGETRP